VRLGFIVALPVEIGLVGEAFLEEAEELAAALQRLVRHRRPLRKNDAAREPQASSLKPASSLTPHAASLSLKPKPHASTHGLWLS